MGSISVFQANTSAELDAVRHLFEEYLTALSTDYDNKIGCAEGQADMLDFPTNYETLFLARLGEKPVAACGMKKVNRADCELVRLYCRPEGRGHKLGKRLTKAVCAHAQSKGYRRLVLSTEPVMTHAVRLYRSMGFADIDNYADAPSACSKYMGLDL